MTASPSAALSDKRLAANRCNAQLSTGPSTPEGKATSSLNAVKTALTGRTVLLPADDADLYRDHCARFAEMHSPVGPQESALVQSLADTEWRLQRIPALEMAIYAVGRARFADQLEHDDPAIRTGLIELETYLAYEKQLRNLHTQESRLRRQREKDSAQLRQLQAERQQAIAQPEPSVTAPPPAPAAPAQPPHPAVYGFEFSISPAQPADSPRRSLQCASAPSPAGPGLESLSAAPGIR